LFGATENSMRKVTFKRGFFVCLVGIDGSGKTTLAKRVVEQLNSRAIDAKYVYSAIFPILLKPFMAVGKRTFLRRTSKFGNYRDYSQKKQEFFSRKKVFASFWRMIVGIDAILQIYWKVAIPIWMGRILVSDRYAYDTLLNVGVGYGASHRQILSSILFFLRLFPNPDVVFLIDIPEEIAMSRKDDVPAIEYLQERRGIYLKLAEAFGMTILDGTKSIDELTETVVNIITKRIGESI
jgi:dTMP kinase